MTRTINHSEAKALARFIHVVRDDWGEHGILAALGQARDQGSLEDVARWALAAALNPSNRGPAIIAMPGSHRAPPSSPAVPMEKFDRTATCDICGLAEAACRARWADDHEFESVERAKARAARDEAAGKRDDVLAWMRESVAESKADGPREPEPREHKPSPNVDALRAELTTQADPAATEATR